VASVRRFLLALPLAAYAVGLAACGSAPTATVHPGPGGPAPTRAFTCPRQSKALDDSKAPALPDLAHQQSIAEAVKRLSYVHDAEPTALGVVALVTGDPAEVTPGLTAAGVTFVRTWDARGPESGMTAQVQVQLEIQDQLDPVADRFRKLAGGVPGSGDGAVWPQAGEVLIPWKEPVPAAVTDLARQSWPHGIRVVVQPVRYSSAELGHAMGTRLDLGKADDGHLTLAYACGDDSGIIVGVDPAAWPAPSGLAADLARQVGYPVMLTKEAAATADGSATG
jgi:hypothetical protein